MWLVAQIFVVIISLVTVVDCQGGGGGGGGGAIFGVGGVFIILICLPIYCCCAGRPRRSNAKFVHKSTTDNNETQIIDIKLFQSGLWQSEYFQYSKCHGPYQVDLFFDTQELKVTGSGWDDVGMYVIDGMYSTQTRRMGLTKTYQQGTGNLSQNLGHNVTIQLEWNRNTNQFEGKCLVSTIEEHWFVLDQSQFPGFYTPLFTLISSATNRTDADEQKNLSFTLSSYERSININTSQQLIKLNIERADLLPNALNHLIFIAIRQETKLETYVNCKLIDSYLLYSTNRNNENEQNSSFTVENLSEGVNYFQLTTEEVFEKFNCKQTGTMITNNNQTTTIGRPLIRKMQHVIEKVQRRKQRSRRQQSSVILNTNSLTIIYKPNIGQFDENGTSFRSILHVSQFAFHIRYYPKEHLFHIRFNNENRTQLILYADKSTDLLSSSSTSQGSVLHSGLSSTVVLFLHITPTMVTCYVNCELTDQEFISDSAYVQNIIGQTMAKTNNNPRHEGKPPMEYDRQSTLVLFNQSIEQIAARFFCIKLDKKNEELLPDIYALRKFANALDVLVNSLDTPMNLNDQTSIASTQNISAVNIHSINGFGSLSASPFNTNLNTISSELIKYDQSCRTDQDCSGNNSFLKCQNEHCTCPSRYFWSPNSHRCISCKDLSIGNRCFRLSNHKSTWYEASDYCRDRNAFDEQQEYTMRLASNLNRTDIELLKHSLVHEDDGEQLDYFYWIGSTSHFDTRQLHKQSTRHKRRSPITIFRWYDTGETAQLNIPEIWCSQREHVNKETIDNNQLCVSLTSCGLYADDCQRNYRFLCEAI